MNDIATENLLDKIRKLQAHADSAADIGSEAEAKAFAAKVQELLTAYKLSMNDVSQNDPKAKEPIDTVYFGWEDIGLKVRGMRIAWAEQLARFVGRAYYCEFVITTAYGRIGFYVGHKTDREVAAFMFVTLARFLDKLANSEGKQYHLDQWKVAGSPKNWSLPPHLNGFRAGFRSGFINRLRERFDDEIRPKTGTDTQAIVLMRKDSLARVQDWMKDNLHLRQMAGVGTGDTSHTAGRNRGRAAADDVNLRPNIISGIKPSGGLLR